jgi:hypothetical protein
MVNMGMQDTNVDIGMGSLSSSDTHNWRAINEHFSVNGCSMRIGIN